tara:strand:+ start:221 stop:649 length:429 start_codon:yes stop_codon:yes gene_type:complete
MRVKDMEIKGIEQLAKNLDRFGKKVKNKAIKEAVLAGSEVVKKGFVRDAPVDTGHLKRNMGVRYRKYSRNGVGIIGAKSLKNEKRNKNVGIYFYVLNFRKNVSKSHYLWAFKSFEKTKNMARNVTVEKLKSEIAKVEKQVAV